MTRVSFNFLFILFVFIRLPVAMAKEDCSFFKEIQNRVNTQLECLVSSIRDLNGKLRGVIAQEVHRCVIENIVSNFEGQTKKFTLVKGKNKSKNKKDFNITLGKRLGGGYVGNVYVVKGIDDQTITGFPSDIELVAKFPNSFRGIEKAPNVTKNGIRREVLSTQIIEDKINLVAEDKQFPKDPAWASGRLPLIPIHGPVETTHGPILFKPLLKNVKLLNQIKKSEVTQEMIESLRDIFDLAQAIDHKIMVKNGKKLEGLSIDIRASNIAWVDDPQMLSVLGYKKPGFVMFEMDQTINNIPTYLERNGLTFDVYYKEFETYLAP